MANRYIEMSTCYKSLHFENMFLALAFCLPLASFARLGYSAQSYCLDGIQTDRLALECQHSQLLKLGRIIYGYSWSNDCSYIDKDCTMAVPREDIHCFSISNCSVRVVEHPLILQDCWNLAATYIQAEYECITDYSLNNICQTQEMSTNQGFLSTPDYPNGFSSAFNCLCTLVALPHHSIVLEIINFNLPACIDAALLLWIGSDSHTKCSSQEPITYISHIHRNVTFRFYTTRTNKHGGFLMKYSLLPESSAATIRLHCQALSTANRSVITNGLTTSKSWRTLELASDHDHEKGLGTTGLSEFVEQRRPSNLAQDIWPITRQLQLINWTDSVQTKHLLPDALPASRSSTNLIVVFIISMIVFLIIVNILVWFMCSLRLHGSAVTSSSANSYSHPLNLSIEGKGSMHHKLIQPTNRLKTLHSLLYMDHRTVDINPIKTSLSHDPDSALSDCHIRSHSSSTNLGRDLNIESKSNEKVDDPRQINSWDDI